MRKKFLFILFAGAIFSACDKGCDERSGECAQEQLEEDVQIIQNYLEDNNLEAERHYSDLFYIINEEGSGSKPMQGQVVEVNYVGKFLSGEVFDTSIDSVARQAGIYDENRTYKPFEFKLGASPVIDGWTIGISLLKEGSTATLLIPSALGYRDKAQGSIPPNTVLLFEVELVNIKF